MLQHEDSRFQILAYCQECLEHLPEQRQFFFEAPESGWLHHVAQFIILLQGSVWMHFPQKGRWCDVEFHAPMILYASKEGYLTTLSERNDPRRLTRSRAISFCYYPNYLRAMHINADGLREPPTERDLFFHTESPLNEVGEQLRKTMELLYLHDMEPEAAMLLNPLLKLSMESLREGKAAPVKPVSRNWDDIKTYIRDHREDNLSRERLAKIFELSPGYLSHLARMYAGCTLLEYIEQCKLEHAVQLLSHTRLRINEIAMRCGFNDTSYFISRFRQRHQVTPHVFRNLLKIQSPNPSE